MKENIRFLKTAILGVVCGLISLTYSANAASYYIDDNSNTGDVYTPAATGSAGGNASLAAPLNSVSALLSSVTLLPGDIVYIDAGVFYEVVTVNASGTAGNPISFIGAGNTLTFIKAPTALATTTPNGVFILDGRKYVVVDGLNISVYDDPGTTADDNMNTATTAIVIKNDADYTIINNCITANVGYAIDVMSYGATTPDNIEIRNCHLTSFYVGVRLKYGPLNSNIHNNSVEIIPKTGSAFAALECQYAYNFNVHHNRFIGRTHPASLPGFRYDEGCTHFGHTSTGTLSNNYIWIDVPFTDELDSNPAIAIDDQSAITFIHNSIYAHSDGFRYNCAQCDASPVTYGLNASLINNIIYSSARDCIDLRCLSTNGTMAGVTVQPKFAVCDGNLYYAPSGNVSTHVPFTNNAGNAGNFLPANSLNRTLAQWQSYDPDNSAGANTGEVDGLYGDPQYINIANIILDIPGSSPAVDAVVRATSIADDIVATARPQGTAKDIGAFEVVISLPVDLIEGRGKCHEGSALLEWTTTNEKDNHHFSIEYSNDGMSYKETGQVTASTSSGLINYYSYSSSEGNGTYRIRQYDINGSSTVIYSVSITCNPSGNLIWWNNGEAIVISGEPLPETGNINFSLYNMLGVELIRSTVPSQAHSITIDPGYLPEATYVIVIQTADSVKSIKINTEALK